MGFASGAASFQRFFIGGKLAGEVDDQFIAALQKHAFGHSPPLPDATQSGWVGPRHLFQTDFTAEQITTGPFVHLALRLDQLKPPPAVVRAYRQLEEQTLLENSGREFLSRSERRQARDAAVSRAEAEARQGMYRRMNAYPVLIDLANPAVYLGTLSASVGDRLSQLFYDTFGFYLESAGPEAVAGRLAAAANQTRALENLNPFTLAPAPSGERDDGPAEFAGDLAFLGKELLTWIWHQTDAEHTRLRIHTGDEITVMIDKVMRLKCDFGMTGTDVITADGPSTLPEAHAALASGKQPDKIGLIIATGAIGELRFVLEGPRLTVSGLVIPEDEEASRTAAERLEARFEMIADTAHLLDALFDTFLQRRWARDWEQDLRKMTAWARGTRERNKQAALA